MQSFPLTPVFSAGCCGRLAFRGQTQRQVGVGENQKPTVKVIIKGNLFLYKFWIWQPSLFKFYTYVYACTYVFGESDWVHFPKRDCTSCFTKCGWEAVFINCNFLFLVMCLHKRVTEMPLAEISVSLTFRVPEWNPTKVRGETQQVQQVWGYRMVTI